uniref:Synaptobrevin, longin-like domain protein n=1 Tax=Tanacetum cinerariifolium TaxID=118510 RepID=A0A699HBT1_TANCI|nr:hypothetical protein [Tanacetum cinerariifolium]
MLSFIRLWTFYREAYFVYSHSGKPVVITKPSIKSDLQFNDVDGIDCLTNEAIFENFALMGYEGDLTKLNFQRALFSPQWKFLIHTIIYYLTSKRDQPPLTESSSEHDTSQEPRVNLKGTSGSGGDQVNLPYDSPLSCGHTSDRAKGFLNLEELSTLCTNLSNRVLALETVKDAQAKEILTLKARIKKLEKRRKPSISHHKAWLRSVDKLSKMKKLGQMESVSKHRRKSDKPRPKLDNSVRLDVDGVEYIETKEDVDEGRTSNKTEELNLDVDTKVIAKDKGSGEKGESTISTARPKRISIARRKRISTGRPKRVSTSSVTISTVDPKVSVVESKTPPITTSIFNDEDITMAQTLIKIKEEKAKEKGVAFKEVKESDRPARSVLTLKPLLTIDPKDKGKAVIEEPELKKMTRSDFDDAPVARDEEIARQFETELHKEVERERQREEQASMDYIPKIYDEVQARIDDHHELAVRLTHEEHDNQLNKRTFEEIQALYIKEQEKDANFVPVGSDEDDRLIQKMNEKEADVHKEKVLKEPANIKVLKMKARKKARKQTPVDDESSDKGMDSSKKRKAGPRMKRMSKRQKTYVDPKEEEHLKTFLKIDSNEEEVVDYEIKNFAEMMTRFDRLDLVELYNLVMQRFETTTPEERRYLLTTKTLERMLSLRLIAESASDAAYVGFITIQQMVISSPCLTDIKNWLVQKQTAFGKDLSNSLMADSSPKNIWFSTHHAS